MTPHLIIIQYRMNLYDSSQCLKIVVKSTNPSNAPVSGRKIRKDSTVLIYFDPGSNTAHRALQLNMLSRHFLLFFSTVNMVWIVCLLNSKHISYSSMQVHTCTVQCIVHNTVYTNIHRTITVDLRFTLHCLHTVTVTLQFTVCRHYMYDTNVYFKP